ncbi:hypothetical protein ScPMuIL_013760 [Solemya velum]
MTEHTILEEGIIGRNAINSEVLEKFSSPGTSDQLDSSMQMHYGNTQPQDQTDITMKMHEKNLEQQDLSQVPTNAFCQEAADIMQHSDICLNTENLTLNDSRKHQMLNRIAKSDAHFKHQQRGEPDLTYQEKYHIAEDILGQKASLFLSRFGKNLQVEDLEYFEKNSDSYEVNFYLREIMKQKDSLFCKNRIKNRRYEALKQMISEGTYFSEEEMKYRDPFLYEQMIGKYMKEEEIADKIDKTDLRLSTILMSHMQQQEENVLYYQQRSKEESQQEEEEDSGEEEEMEEHGPADKKVQNVTDERREELRGEFLRIMQERFLSGGDQDFDYSRIDENADYDDLDELDKDEEEKYFDEDDDRDLDISDP